ncbi:hypothetical protein GCM10028773_13820 [Spirosoma koreense]
MVSLCVQLQTRVSSECVLLRTKYTYITYPKQDCLKKILFFSKSSPKPINYPYIQRIRENPILTLNAMTEAQYILALTILQNLESEFRRAYETLSTAGAKQSAELDLVRADAYKNAVKILEEAKNNATFR